MINNKFPQRGEKWSCSHSPLRVYQIIRSYEPAVNDKTFWPAVALYENKDGMHQAEIGDHNIREWRIIEEKAQVETHPVKRFEALEQITVEMLKRIERLEEKLDESPDLRNFSKRIYFPHLSSDSTLYCVLCKLPLTGIGYVEGNTSKLRMYLRDCKWGRDNNNSCFCRDGIN